MLAFLLLEENPTKSHRLYKILEIIEKLKMRKRTITTNGSGLFDLYNGKNLLQYLIDNNFQHLNISKAHFDEDTNQSIMNFDKDYCSNEMLAKIIPYAKKYNLRPRLSCLLLKDGIHDIESMMDFMDFYKKYGIDNVIFRELMDYDKEKMINKEKMDYCTKNKIKLNKIWSDIDNNKLFSPIKNILGYYYYVEIYKYHNIIMCSESANINKLYIEKQKNPDNVYEMIFHPNGNLNGSWVDDEDILLKYKDK